MTKVNLTLQPVILPSHLEGEGGHTSRGKHWDNATLWRSVKGLEPFDLPLCAIDLDIKPWTLTNIRWLLYHVKRIDACDFDYPVIMDPDGFIIDGWHRVAKAILESKLSIKAVRLEVMPEADRVLTENE